MNVQIAGPVLDPDRPATADQAAAVTRAPASLRLWGLAALAAVAIHAMGIALVIVSVQNEDRDDDLGAPGLEVGLELTAPHLDPTDLPPGPAAEDLAPSPPVVEQKAKAEETELPKARPTETDDPDRLVTPDASRKPKDDDPKISAMETMPSTEAVASEATAPPTSETAPELQRSTTPAQGVGESAQRALVTWERQLGAHLNKHKRYPAAQARRNAETLVSFTLDRTGHVLSAAIVRTSGNVPFDEAALAMLRRSDPVPPPPPRVADEGLTFTLPVIFRAKGAH